MQIEDVRAWHWAVIGVLVGLAFSAVLAVSGPWFDTESLETITQGEFETRLLGGCPPNERYFVDQFHVDASHNRKAMIRDVLIHPPAAGDATNVWWVTGKSCDVKIDNRDPKDPKSPRVVVEEWTPFKYPAPAPYVPGYAMEISRKREAAAKAAREAKVPGRQANRVEQLAAPIEADRAAFDNKEQFDTVVDYLAAVRTAEKSLKAQDVPSMIAWWDKPKFKWTLPPAAGLLVIGIAWPLTLSALQRVGMAAPPQRAVKAKPATQPAGGPSAYDDGVREPTANTARPPPVESKEYGGEFYPVVKQVHK